MLMRENSLKQFSFPSANNLFKKKKKDLFKASETIQVRILVSRVFFFFFFTFLLYTYLRISLKASACVSSLKRRCDSFNIRC